MSIKIKKEVQKKIKSERKRINAGLKILEQRENWCSYVRNELDAPMVDGLESIFSTEEIQEINNIIEIMDKILRKDKITEHYLERQKTFLDGMIAGAGWMLQYNSGSFLNKLENGIVEELKDIGGNNEK